MHFTVQIFSAVYGETLSRTGYDSFIIPTGGMKVSYNLQVWRL